MADPTEVSHQEQLFERALALFPNAGGMGVANYVQNAGCLKGADDLVEISAVVLAHIREVCQWHHDLLEAGAAGHLNMPEAPR